MTMHFLKSYWVFEHKLFSNSACKNSDRKTYGFFSDPTSAYMWGLIYQVRESVTVNQQGYQPTCHL